MAPRSRRGAGSERGDRENVFNTKNKMFALTFFGMGRNDRPGLGVLLVCVRSDAKCRHDERSYDATAGGWCAVREWVGNGNGEIFST